MHDRAMQALDLLALDPLAETVGAPPSSGCRPQRSPADALAPCCKALARQHAPPWMWEGDIRAWCDGSSQDGFLAPLPMETALLQQGLQAGCMAQHVLSPPEAGVPQGAAPHR